MRYILKYGSVVLTIIMANKMIDTFKNKVVLVTGGTGSFGQHFVKKLLQDYDPKKIIIFSRDEFKQHEMRQTIADPKKKLRFFLGDVRDVSRLQRAFSGVDYIVHAAALKQVPALEYNPLEAIKTNVAGTQNVIEAALDNGVKKVVLISTDKAVNPINLYGATKLCAEKLLIAANSYRKNPNTTKLSVVRYGNVIGSRGSIVEVLHKQKETGVVTITDKRMTRFWITLDEGVNLVINALFLMVGGEIFVPKLPAMKVTDLMATVATNCKIKEIGIRPGEKIHEALLTEDEVRRTKDIGKYYVVEPHLAEADKNFWEETYLKKYKNIPNDFNYSSHKAPMLHGADFLKIIES